MGRYRKKPVIIEAFRWTGGPDQVENPNWIVNALGLSWGNPGAAVIMQNPLRLDIFTLEGVMSARPGDWIIRGTKGELYPCKPDIFAATYEIVVEPSFGCSGL